MLPKLGIVPVIEKESGRTIWVNSSFGDFRQTLASAHQERTEHISAIARKHQINYLNIQTHEDFVPKLLRLFKLRNKSVKL